MYEVGTRLIRIQTGQHYVIEKTELSKVKGKLLKKEVLYHLKSEYHSSLDLIVHEDELKKFFKRVRQTYFDICCESIENMAQIIDIAKVGWTKEQIIAWLQSEAE